MFQIVPTEYNKAMVALAAKFQVSLKNALAKPYPFAPGYNGGRTAFGVRNMKKQTGDLFNSITVKYDEQQQEVVISMLDYWQNVNDGRRPGKYVPIKPLMEWIRHKGFNKNKKTGKFQKFNIKGMAFAVSKNIQKFGIQPTNFYDIAFQEFEAAFEDEAIIALGIDASNFFEKVIETNTTK